MAQSKKDQLEMSQNGDAKKENTDQIQSLMGELGRWQIFVCGVVFLLKFPVAWHQMAIIFLAPKTDFTCVDESLEKCDKSCKEHVFDQSVFNSTIQSEWDLVCNRSILSSLSQTIFMLGILFGNMVFGVLADKFGRRKPLVFAVIIQLFFGVAASFSPNYWLFIIFRFVIGLATGGTMITSFVLVMEIIGVKWRELICVLYQIPFNVGHLMLPLFAYFIRDWRTFQFAVSIPSVLLLSYYWLIPESPRWLFTTGRVNESIEVLEKAAKCNKLPTENIKTSLEATHSAKTDTERNARGNFFDLYRTPNLRLRTICMHFNWFVCGMCFFGVSQYVGELGGNIFINVTISAASTIPGTIICIFLLKYWGRKKSLIMSNCLAGFSMLAIAFIDQKSSTVIVVLATFALTGMCISFPNVYIYGGEIFPTVIRNIGVGSASTFARVGSMIAPFVAKDLGTAVHWLPPLIFGVIPLIGAGLAFFLPETRGCKLPETIEDSENFGKKKKMEA